MTADICQNQWHRISTCFTRSIIACAQAEWFAFIEWYLFVSWYVNDNYYLLYHTCMYIYVYIWCVCGSPYSSIFHIYLNHFTMVSASRRPSFVDEPEAPEEVERSGGSNWGCGSQLVSCVIMHINLHRLLHAFNLWRARRAHTFNYIYVFVKEKGFCSQEYLYIYIYVFYLYRNRYIHAYIHTYMHAYMHTCIHTYIHMTWHNTT